MKIKRKVKKRLIFVISLAIVLTNCFFIIFGNSVLAAPEPAETGGVISEATKRRK